MQLVFESGSLKGQVYDLPVGRTLVGRSADCTLVVPDPGVAGHHAELDVRGDGTIVVRDLGS